MFPICCEAFEDYVFNSVTFSQKEDIDSAVKIARKTFESGVWSKSDPSFRKKILLKL